MQINQYLVLVTALVSNVTVAQGVEFEYSLCTSIRDVTVPYEITLDDDIRFTSEQGLELRIDSGDQIFDANDQPYVLDSELTSTFALHVREFARIGRRFALRFGSIEQVPDPANWTDPATDEDEDDLQLFADSCRNLYQLKRVQTAMAEQLATFQPVIIVDGIDLKTVAR